MPAMGSIHQSCVPLGVGHTCVGTQLEERLHKALVPAMSRVEQRRVALWVLGVHSCACSARLLRQPDLLRLLVLPLALRQQQQWRLPLVVNHVDVTTGFDGSLRGAEVLLAHGGQQQGAVLFGALALIDQVAELIAALCWLLRRGIARQLLLPILQGTGLRRFRRLPCSHHVSRRPPKRILLCGICSAVQQQLDELFAASLRRCHQRGLS
mmetsp:Transcript_116320/g.290435  ORF Transcript_116320/g.290435 Transcript_116320/m.290435 type:complete len:210 (-) Transcript_116320:322-951(-)